MTTPFSTSSCLSLSPERRKLANMSVIHCLCPLHSTTQINEDQVVETIKKAKESSMLCAKIPGYNEGYTLNLSKLHFHIHSTDTKTPEYPKWQQSITKRSKSNPHSHIPWGIHVSLTESRLFLLLNAVLIPMTTKAFWRPSLTSPTGLSSIGDPLILDCWDARAAASSISKDDIVLSRFLQEGHLEFGEVYNLQMARVSRTIQNLTIDNEEYSWSHPYLIAKCVFETSFNMSFWSPLPGFWNKLKEVST